MAGTLGRIQSNVDLQTEKALTLLDNQYVRAVVAIVCIMYASMYAPVLPAVIANVFDYTLVKLALMFLLLVNIQVEPFPALVVSLALVLLVWLYGKYSGESMCNVQMQGFGQAPDVENDQIMQQPQWDENKVAEILKHVHHLRSQMGRDLTNEELKELCDTINMQYLSAMDPEVDATNMSCKLRGVNENGADYGL